MFLWITTVAGMTTLLLISMSFFIHFLRVGLDSKSSVHVDPKPKA